ncbi:8-oxo-dGTP pyrophosphatase MutT, NUDIX family [Roseovarius pacificus]|uniref:8-oxo-dGTP pyrophosphatase MutT, NUDIX family n=1 Tax=Roseovarius pacificus TaxID=337701 RepID=A0A1M7E0B9_9RHOB|nr:CoA pyrophosphatase [Roseovarius pacificus]GGO57300.1 coenzyme A pyrophosphatase [Roseovarius pacificus]SHL85182.1 8-oxo-dGTP pyrophosphatase MutT, NUDIX family [Roseovarius pacificus]
MADPLDRIRVALAGLGQASSDFDLNPEAVLPPGRKLRPAGVLVPILYQGSVASVYLTKRSSALKHHPGQIAFPGGKQDESDADITAAALREAHEEIGLKPENVEVLGLMPAHETVTAFRVTPVVARVRAPFQLRPEAGEVDEVFSVPLDHLLNSARFSVQSRRWQGRMRHYYTVPFGPYYIWGATARILRALADATETE